MIKIKILIVEDEKSLLDVLKKRLAEAGYIVDDAENGEDALLLIGAYEYDVIILDIMIPKINGLQVLSSLREKEISTPVLLLTALDSTSDKVLGLDSGADDYLVKPFVFDELMARLRVLLRRNSETKTNTLAIGDIALDVVKRSVSYKDQDLDFTAKEFAIFEYMLRNKGNILTRSQITEHVWEYDTDIESNVVDVYIRYIRRKIETFSNEQIIHTIRGIGYVIKE